MTSMEFFRMCKEIEKITAALKAKMYWLEKAENVLSSDKVMYPGDITALIGDIGENVKAINNALNQIDVDRENLVRWRQLN